MSRADIPVALAHLYEPDENQGIPAKRPPVVHDIRFEPDAPPEPKPAPRKRRKVDARSAKARAYWTPERCEEHGARLRAAFARTRAAES